MNLFKSHMNSGITIAGALQVLLLHLDVLKNSRIGLLPSLQSFILWDLYYIVCVVCICRYVLVLLYIMYENPSNHITTFRKPTIWKLYIILGILKYPMCNRNTAVSLYIYRKEVCYLLYYYLCPSLLHFYFCPWETFNPMHHFRKNIHR